jgi:hypothetical protein
LAQLILPSGDIVEANHATLLPGPGGLVIPGSDGLVTGYPIA